MNKAKEAPEKKQRKTPPEKRLFHKPITPVKIVIYCGLALALTGAALAARFAYVTLFDRRAAFPNATPRPYATDVPAGPAPTATLSPEELLALQADTDFMKDRVNILLTGIDYAEEREGRTDFRTDTMMLFSVNFATGHVDILSFPRDSYADIAYTKNRWKLNGAFMSAGGAEGRGFECMMETISNVIGGIRVDYYFALDMQAVKDIVDIIGGVWYDVDVEVAIGGRHIGKGYQLLDGQAVLDYCRVRKGVTSGTDIDRIDRQQRLLLEVFNQLKSTNLLPRMPDIYNTIQSKVYTNLNLEQIAALAFFALDFDLETQCSRHTLKGEFLQYFHYYYVLDHAYTREVIEKIFGEKPKVSWMYSVNYVKADMAGIAYDEALAKLEDCLKAKGPELPDELIAKAEEQIRQGDKLRADLEKSLPNAAKSNKKINTTDIDAATKGLEDLARELSRYEPPLPTPPPTTAGEPGGAGEPAGTEPSGGTGEPGTEP